MSQEIDFETGVGKGRVQGKVAIVTGSGAKGDFAGVGQAIAEVLAREGASLAVLDVNTANAERTVSRIVEAGGNAIAVTADVRSEDECKAAVDQTVKHFGGLDILVNNAAVHNNYSKQVRITDLNVEDWQRIFEVNVNGALFMTRYAIPAMNGDGSIVAISTIGTIQPGADVSYNSSKGALERLMLVTAMDYGKEGIRANCIRPGAIWSELMSEQYPDEVTREQIREHRKGLGAVKIEGTSWDIAMATLFFASDDARFISGQTINVDAGWGTMADHSFMKKMIH
jgi:NAD(P)-dependent dehydrogenase (short-subunit alcohol dehydrogenase family)